MIKEFKDESQAKAVAESLGLIITKYKGVYIVSNNKEEMLAEYNLGYYSEENIFYDKEIFKETWGLIIRFTSLVDASSVELPCNLKDCSYMFKGCSSLKIPPIIPKSVRDCAQMFEGCTSLKEPPIIPEGAKSCREMFCGCTSLTTPPIIPEGVKDCVRMFSECISLKTPPIIPKGVESCRGMFEGCTSLITLPIIPESVNNCYRMFQGCTSLKTPPHFPINCYTEGVLLNTPFEEMRRN